MSDTKFACDVTSLLITIMTPSDKRTKGTTILVVLKVTVLILTVMEYIIMIFIISFKIIMMKMP